MTFAPGFSYGSYLPETIEIPEDQKEQLEYLKTRLEEILRSLNRKDIATYDLVELMNGHQFFGADPQNKRYVYRKVFQFGAIAAGATLLVAHGITQMTSFTRIYGTAVTNVVDYRPIPYSSVTNVNLQIQITVGAANITIVNGAAAPAITSGLVILEFLKN